MAPRRRKGLRPGGWQMLSISHGGGRRLRGSARYGVMLVTIALAVLSVLALAHEVEHLFSGISHGLAT